MVGPNILDYRVPTIVESPHIEVKIVETMDPGGPFGAKEASEGAHARIIPAIANAVHDAVGVRLTKTPLTPDRVINAIIKQERDAKRASARGAA